MKMMNQNMSKNKNTPVLGLGNDIIEIERIRESLEKHQQRFLDRLFTPKEQLYCQKYEDPIPHYAGRFAAKEAIAKAFGTGIGEHISWQDIEILSESEGAPKVHFSDRLNALFDHPQILVSISHCKLYVTAVALWMK